MLRQFDDLNRHINGDLSVVIVEGDSIDDTYKQLIMASELRSYLTIVQRHHYGSHYGSIVHKERFRQLSVVGNYGMDKMPECDFAMIIESDLIWDVETIKALFDKLRMYPVMAPMVLKKNTNHFYDIWAFRQNGVHFRATPPYCDNWPSNDQPIMVSSVGSCVAMRGEYAQHARYTAEDVIVGLCNHIYDLGGSVWVDPTLTVYHQ